MIARRISVLSAVAGCLVLCLCLGSALRPAAAQNFYEGKTISIIVGLDAGSGYDAYARLLARHMSRYIGGRPTIIVQNMPGAASVKAADYIHAIAPKDGTQFAIVFPNALVDPLAAEPGKFRYDPTRLAYIGTADSGTRLFYTIGNSKVRTIEDARVTKAIMGSTARGSPTWDYALMLNALAGTRFEVVTGYKGPADIFIAMERGEIDGMSGIDVSTVKALRPDWLGSGKAHFLLQAGIETNAEMTALGIPSIWKYIADGDRSVVELIVSQQVFQRPYIAPPETPAAQLGELRKAFLAAHKDPELLDEAQRMKLSISPKSGEEVAALVRQIYSTPKGLVDRMTSILRH